MVSTDPKLSGENFRIIIHESDMVRTKDVKLLPIERIAFEANRVGLEGKRVTEVQRHSPPLRENGDENTFNEVHYTLFTEDWDEQRG